MVCLVVKDANSDTMNTAIGIGIMRIDININNDIKNMILNVHLSRSLTYVNLKKLQMIYAIDGMMNVCAVGTNRDRKLRHAREGGNPEKTLGPFFCCAGPNKKRFMIILLIGTASLRS
jgi:hypothetical protein